MAIYQRGKIWWIDYYFQGRRFREPVSESKRGAIDALQARKGDVVKGKFDLAKKQKDVPFEEFAIEYLEYLRANRRWWKYEAYRLKVLVRHFGKHLMRSISPSDVEKFKTERRKTLSGSAVNRELALLKVMFNRANEWGMASLGNPVRSVKYFPEFQKENILSVEEAKRLVAACGISLKPVVVVALNTGMRKSELLELQWKDVDFERKFIRVVRSKNNKARKIPMNSDVIGQLRELRSQGSGYVFSKAKGRTSERLRCIKTAFHTACRRAGIQSLRFHDLRHTFATNLVMSGVDLVTVKEILGHSDISMTVRYSHPSDERKMSAVERLVEVRPRELEVSEGDGHNLVTIAQEGQKESPIIH